MLGLLSSPLGRQPGFAASSRVRLEARPPSLRHRPSSRWQRLMFWLMAPAPLDAAPPLDRLPAVREDFAACLDDTTGDRACALAERIERARSLRELWHLRPDVFDLVARQHSQAEAESRIARLNRHFPTRSPRSGFAPLQA
jgi:hypothetical protein